MADGSVSKPAVRGGAPEAVGAGAAPLTFWQRTFAALRYRNYRLWFMGQLVSLVGTWMQITAQSVLVFELTPSTAYWATSASPTGCPRGSSCSTVA